MTFMSPADAGDPISDIQIFIIGDNNAKIQKFKKHVGSGDRRTLQLRYVGIHSRKFHSGHDKEGEMIIKQFKIGRYTLALSWTEEKPGAFFWALITLLCITGVLWASQGCPYLL